MLHHLLQRILFRVYNINVDGRDYLLRIPRWRFYYRGERVDFLSFYVRHTISEGKTPLLPPGVKVFVDVD